MKLTDRVKKAIDEESDNIDKVKFGKVDISITVQDGQPHMMEITVNKKKKCKVNPK